MDKQPESWSPKKKAIIEATISTLAQEGFARTTTARIAGNAKAGEGSIYRHFKNKDDLIQVAALYSARKIFGSARRNYNPDSSVHAQFVRFCTDFLSAGKNLQIHHQFLEQYLNSPLGIAYRKKVLETVMVNSDIQPIFFPLNAILVKGTQLEILKDLPIQYLVALSMGPMSFMLKNAAQGFMELSEDRIEIITYSCWEAIRR
ncbi:TetR/AcrR family transcriptional regulator [Desulfosediminicola sp.]|uniref:TetR/AcrR family transcriptional regulator n=1 Tax=Desulfosediminicola sp. TaxID=2886825 RepID=UPI003AF28AAE